MNTKPLGGRRKIPSDWRLVVLDEIKSEDYDACRAGPFGSSISRKYFVESGIPVIRGNNLSTDLTEFIAKDFAFVTEQRTREKYKSCIVRSGDLVFTCWGTIGQVGRIPENGPFDEYVISNKQLKLRTNPNIANSKFVYYYVASAAGVEYIQSRAIGAAVPGINLGIMKSIPIALPPMATQVSIINILSAYDDLIENNRRRILLLEQAARLLYKEWFVHLRFPGHEHVKIKNGIPEGWSLQPLPAFCREVTDGTHDSPKPVEEGFYLVTGRHIVDGFIDFSSCYKISQQEHAKVMKRCKPEKGDIIFSNIGTLGNIVLVNQSFEFSIKNVALFKPLNPLLSVYLYTYFSYPGTLKELLNQASGTSQRFLSLKVLRSVEVLLPDKITLDLFNQSIEPLLNQRSLLKDQADRLAEARDLLLPRLMNGKVTV